jgi:uncharacterized protein
MKIHGPLPETIAVFPLPGAVLLPRGRLPLHIFEPRYLAMIEDCLKTPQRLIGMVQTRDVPGKSERRLLTIGCAGRLTAFSETEDGRYMITLGGVSRFRILEEIHPGTPYRQCRVDWASFARDLGAAEADPGFDRAGFMAQLRRYFAARGLSTDWGALDEAEPEMLINTLSMLCPFSPEDKQALIEAPTLSNRRETLGALIEFALHGGQDQESSPQ